MMKRYAHAAFDSRSRAMQIIEREIGDDNNSAKDDEVQWVFEKAAAGGMSLEEFRKWLDDF
jgi:hypothetical protein